MPVAIDTSVLILAERGGSFEHVLPSNEGPYYIPVHSASEFLIGMQNTVRADLRLRAQAIYHSKFLPIVSPFFERDAAQLAALIHDLKISGQQMKFFDAAIAATVLARGDKLLADDSDFDRLSDRIEILKPAKF